MWQKLLYLAVAGAVGTLVRYGLSGLVQRLTGAAYPWGTVAVNALGCLGFGLVWSLAESRQLLTPSARLVVLTGFMGAFTTFSTYAFETSQLIREDQWFAALGHIVLQNVLGLAMVSLGFAAGRLAEPIPVG